MAVDTPRVMTIEEINESFDSEWVLVDQPEVDEVLRVQRGTVLWHGKDKDELHRVVRAIPEPFSLAILYTGRLRDDIEYLI
jgi:hypothetical protein